MLRHRLQMLASQVALASLHQNGNDLQLVLQIMAHVCRQLDVARHILVLSQTPGQLPLHFPHAPFFDKSPLMPIDGDEQEGIRAQAQH